jgi:DNA-binding PadR family transcriptional regulator
MEMFGKLPLYNGNRISPSQMVMMVLLMHKPMYGYEVIKDLREKYEGIWVPQTGAVYPALRKLQDHGLLSVENQDGKDYYHLSDEGVQWLREELARLPMGALYMMRTLELMGDLLANLPERKEEFVPLDMGTPEDQLKQLMELREKMSNNLRMIDASIADLEKELRQ